MRLFGVHASCILVSTSFTGFASVAPMRLETSTRELFTSVISQHIVKQSSASCVVPHKKTHALVLHFLVLDLDDHQDCHCFCTLRLVRTCHPHCCSLLSTRSCWLHSCILSATFLMASSFAFVASLSGLVLGVQSLGALRALSLISFFLLLPTTSHPSQSRVWGSSFGLWAVHPTEGYDSRDRSLWLCAAHVSSTMACLITVQSYLSAHLLCCIHRSSLRLLAVLVNTRPARFVKRLCALLVNPLFSTVFR